MASKFMNKANEPISMMLDTREMKVPVDGFIRCRPNLAKTAPVPQQRAAVIASTTPNTGHPKRDYLGQSHYQCPIYPNFLFSLQAFCNPLHLL